MQTQNRFFDDIARLLGGAAGTLSGLRNEIEGIFRHQFERLLANTELVSRDEFEILHTLAQTTRGSQESLEQRLAVLETRAASGSRPSFHRRLPSRRRAAASLRQAVQRRGEKEKKRIVQK